jgi:hypothetical protein
MPQPPPVLHEPADDEGLNENELPAPREANVESFFFTCGLPQLGQDTSETASELRTSSSKGRSQPVQTNSKSGIDTSW